MAAAIAAAFVAGFRLAMLVAAAMALLGAAIAWKLVEEADGGRQRDVRPVVSQQG